MFMQWDFVSKIEGKEIALYEYSFICFLMLIVVSGDEIRTLLVL